MYHHASSTTPDDRRDLRNRFIVGICIAVGGLAALGGYVILRPERAATALLVVGGLAGVGLLMWIKRAVDGGDHRGHADRIGALETRVQEVLTAVDASRITHSSELQTEIGGLASVIEELIEKVEKLGGQVEAVEVRRQVGRARTSAEEALGLLAADGGRPRGGYSPTPPGGIQMHNLSRRHLTAVADTREEQ